MSRKWHVTYPWALWDIKLGEATTLFSIRCDARRFLGHEFYNSTGRPRAIVIFHKFTILEELFGFLLFLPLTHIVPGTLHPVVRKWIGYY